jgi:hypothetical protein
MPKESDSRNENRGRPSMGRGDQKASREERRGNLSDFRQQGRQEGPGNLNDARQQSREEGPGNAGGLGGYRKLFQGNRKMFEGKGMGKGNNDNAKNGCFPKLFMLLLPFMAVGTYLLLRS